MFEFRTIGLQVTVVVGPFVAPLLHRAHQGPPVQNFLFAALSDFWLGHVSPVVVVAEGVDAGQIGGQVMEAVR